jgi:hypothetical protein
VLPVPELFMDWPEIIDYRKWIRVGYLLAGIAAVLVLLYWSVRTVSYDITRRHLRIKLFGIPVRWILLTDIHAISRQPVWYSEKWHNTWRVGNRRLMIQKRGGLSRIISISPESPFVFRAQIVNARNLLLPPAPEETGGLPSGDGTVILRQS